MTANSAHAPYNFVPLPEKILPAEPLPEHDIYNSERKSGYFTVTLTTKTPLYIRGMLNNVEVNRLTELEKALKELKYQANADRRQIQELETEIHLLKHKADFFAWKSGVPLIPGSSLRGMLRSIFEIITWSRLQPFNDDRFVFRGIRNRTPVGEYYSSFFTGELPQPHQHYPYPLDAVQAGYLRKDNEGWYIETARTISVQGHLRTVSSFVLVPRNVAEQQLGADNLIPHQVIDVILPNSSLNRGTHITQHGSIHLYIYVASKIGLYNGDVPLGFTKAKLIIPGTMPADNRRWYPAVLEVSATANHLRISEKIWELYEADATTARSEGRETRIIKESDPLFYLLDTNGEVYFIGPTMMFRIPYQNGIKSTIRYTEDINGLDITEAVFGTVNEEKKQVIKGRVSVTDGILTSNPLTSLSEQIISPDVLEKPKPTSVQLYLKPTKDRVIRHYDSKNVRIRGHKLYWRKLISNHNEHELENSTDVVRRNGKLDKSRTRMRLVKIGSSFQFRVYFENLTDFELGALSWAISLGKNSELHHMIGMGKPLGLGAIEVTEITLSISDRLSRYKSFFSEFELSEIKEEADVTQNSIKAFTSQMKILLGRDFDTHPRIMALKAILSIRPNTPRLQYMPLKDFTRRELLPTPQEVLEELN